MRGQVFLGKCTSLQFRWCDTSFEKMIAEETLCGTQTAKAHRANLCSYYDWFILSRE